MVWFKKWRFQRRRFQEPEMGHERAHSGRKGPIRAWTVPMPPQTPPHLLVMRGSAPQTPRGLDFRILHLSTSPDWLIWSLTGWWGPYQPVKLYQPVLSDMSALNGQQSIETNFRFFRWSSSSVMSKYSSLFFAGWRVSGRI